MTTVVLKSPVAGFLQSAVVAVLWCHACPQQFGGLQDYNYTVPFLTVVAYHQHTFPSDSTCGRKRTLFHCKWASSISYNNKLLSLECFIEITPDFHEWLNSMHRATATGSLSFTYTNCKPLHAIASYYVSCTYYAKPKVSIKYIRWPWRSPTASPSLRTASPSLRTASPSLRTASPSLRTASPSLRTASPSLRTASPSLRTASPSLRTASPSLRTASPSLRTASPSLRTASPSLRTASPSLRTASPSLRSYVSYFGVFSRKHARAPLIGAYPTFTHYSSSAVWTTWQRFLKRYGTSQARWRKPWPFSRGKLPLLMNWKTLSLRHQVCRYKVAMLHKLLSRVQRLGGEVSCFPKNKKKWTKKEIKYENSAPMFLFRCNNLHAFWLSLLATIVLSYMCSLILQGIVGK